MTSPEQADVEAMKAEVKRLAWELALDVAAYGATANHKQRSAFEAAIDRLAAVALHPQQPNVHLAVQDGSAPALPAANMRPLTDAQIELAWWSKGTEPDGGNLAGGCTLTGWTRAVRWAEEIHGVAAQGQAPACSTAHTLSSAAIDVLAERQRQITAEGWTPEHDDEHAAGDLALAAACYALPDTHREIFPRKDARDVGRSADETILIYDDVLCPHLWPWHGASWKPKTRRNDLVKAAALILAEIERLDRQSNGASDVER
jgi:hypothetical protein